MKALNLRKSYLVGLAILALAATATFVTVSDLSAVEGDTGVHYFIGEHEFGTGGATFESASAESISADFEEKSIDRNGLTTRKINVRGMAGRGFSEGMGETVYWLDRTRPVEGSFVRAKQRGADFPAVHEMHFHLFLTTDIFPGKTLRSINPAVMVNNNATSFPPRPGARYQLKNVVEFEDTEEPGVVVLSILDNRNEMVEMKRPTSLRPLLEPRD